MTVAVRIWAFFIPVLLSVLPLNAQQYVLIGWNDLGMHCSNKNFSKVVVLPPYNNVTAQLLLRQDNQSPRIVTSGYTVEYSIPNNTYSVGKTDFWTYAQQLFGLPDPLPPDIGLTGKGLTGILDSAGPSFFSAHGIPVTPFADSDLVHETPFQLIRLTAKNTATGATLATTDVVIPVSNEVGCVQSGCHSSETAILNNHESVTGFNRNGPVLCASCHASNALGTTGKAEAMPFSYRMHSKHSEVAGPANSITTCYKCHPGPNTQCLRDIMGKNPSNPLVCQNCHGTMDTVAQTILAGRRPWLDEPKCGTCHGSNYAEEPGKLYRQSVGHGGLYCSACHGSPHAILPTINANDNLQSTRLQGYAGALRKCSVCHATTPSGPGPHGLMDTTAGPPAPPVAPFLARPVNGATGISSSPQIQWTGSAGASAYEIQIADDALFTSIVLDDSALSQLSVQPVLGTGPHTYYWHVRGKNSAGWGMWSSIWSFTTAAPVLPSAPLLALPLNGSTGIATIPQMKWNAAANGQSYHLQIATDSLFTLIVTDDSSVTGTSAQFILGSGPVTYFWHVRANNAAGAGAWSETWSFTTASGTTMTFSVSRSWNMVSLPLAVTAVDVVSVFPAAVSRAYEFSPGGMYVRQDTLVPGKGYWVKFAGQQIVGLTGVPFHSDTVGVSAGWNLVGAISDPVPAASVGSVPSGIISSGFFSYKGNYSIQDTLLPGHAYWVRASVPGSLVLSAGGAGSVLKNVSEILQNCDQIRISDSTGAAQTLYLSPETSRSPAAGMFDLPPVPPAGSFDVRFASNRFLEVVRPGMRTELPVVMAPDDNPVTIEWAINAIRGSVSLDLGGVLISVSGTGSLSLPKGSLLTGISITPPAQVPQEFVLAQNYPNPFNPSTMFRYAVPLKAHVRLSVYNLAGQEIATLVNTTEEQGIHEVQWTPDLASGMYFYRMDAVASDNPQNVFHQIRKLVLLK